MTHHIHILSAKGNQFADKARPPQVPPLSVPLPSELLPKLFMACVTNEPLYKPPMNPCVVSSCLRASLRFPYATHVSAYAAVSEHVKLTHRLRVSDLSVSPQEWHVDDSEEEDEEELPSRVSAAFSLQVKKRVTRQRHPSRGLAGSRAKRACANLTRLLT